MNSSVARKIPIGSVVSGWLRVFYLEVLYSTPTKGDYNCTQGLAEV